MRLLGLPLCAFALLACSSGNSDHGPTLDAGSDSALDSSTPTDSAITDAISAGDSPADVDAGFVTANHPAFPQIDPGDGVVLSPLHLVTIVATDDPKASTFTAFDDALVGSTWWSAMDAAYGLGVATNVNVTGPAMDPSYSTTQLVAYVQALIDAKAAPAPDGSTMYLVYFPIDTVLSLPQGLNTACHIESGGHFAFDAKNDAIAYTQRCNGNTTTSLRDAENTGSHEVIESATDSTGRGWGLQAPTNQPWRGDPWRTMDFGFVTEVADLCAGASYFDSAFEYARTWSNAAASAGGDPCIPPIAEPYYSLAPSVGWTPIAAGASADIPLTAWSTGPMDDWAIETAEFYTNAPGVVTATLTAPRTEQLGAQIWPIVNNGEVATMHVTVSATATHGTWTTFAAYSLPLGSPSTDRWHTWPVSVYIP